MSAACSKTAESEPSAEAQAFRHAAAGSYPQGAWRLADQALLERTSLSLSHILIRHTGSDTTQAPLVAADWRVLPPAVRDEDAARQRAEQLVKAAQEQPEYFPTLARDVSDDPLTSPFGGSLGVLPASQLLPWPEILDAYANLKPGEVSNVVETFFGFHILRRDQSKPEELVSGQRIIIGYREAEFLQFNSFFASPPERDHEAALALALEVAAVAKRDPGAFERLVHEYSEHWDRGRAGDLGVWSVNEPSVIASEIAILQTLDIGAVAEPIDTPLGYSILKRVVVSPRERFAAEVARFPFNPTATVGEAGFRGDVEQQASRALSLLAAGEPINDETTAERWSDGRGERNFTPHVRNLRVGEWSPKAIESNCQYVLLRRLDDAEALVPSTWNNELPNQVDLAYWLAAASESTLRKLIRRSLDSVGESELVLRAEPELLSQLSVKSNPTARQKVVEEWLEHISSKLEPRSREQFKLGLERSLRARLTGGAHG